MSEMSVTNKVNNGVDGAVTNGGGLAPARCPTDPSSRGCDEKKVDQEDEYGCYGMLFSEQPS